MSKKQIKLLVVEDSSLDRRLIEEYLKDAEEYDFAISFAVRLSEAISSLKTGDFDAMVVDLGLPDSQGLETFYSIYSKAPSIPCVILSGLHNEDLAKQSVEDGAHDYLVKSKIDSRALIRSIRYAIRRQSVRNKMKAKLGGSELQELKQKSLDLVNVEIGKNKASEKPSSDTKDADIVRSPADLVERSKKFAEVDQSEFVSRYENIVSYLIEHNLIKSSELIEDISRLARDFYEHGFSISDLDRLRVDQKFIPQENFLHTLIMTDLVSEMVKLAHDTKFNVKTEIIKEEIN